MPDRSTRRPDLSSLLMLALAVVFLSGCGEDPSPGPRYSELKVLGVTYTGCKTFSQPEQLSLVSPGETCLWFNYDGRDTLEFKRYNACFNCCPAALRVEAELIGSLMILMEWDVFDSVACMCLCMYDLEFKIGGISPGEYTFAVTGPYEENPAPDQPLQFTVDLRAIRSGTFCVDRTGYPWPDTVITTTPR